jgi:hypothetical protein
VIQTPRLEWNIRLLNWIIKTSKQSVVCSIFFFLSQ